MPIAWLQIRWDLRQCVADVLTKVQSLRRIEEPVDEADHRRRRVYACPRQSLRSRIEALGVLPQDGSTGWIGRAHVCKLDGLCRAVPVHKVRRHPLGHFISAPIVLMVGVHPLMLQWALGQVQLFQCVEFLIIGRGRPELTTTPDHSEDVVDRVASQIIKEVMVYCAMHIRVLFPPTTQMRILIDQCTLSHEYNRIWARRNRPICDQIIHHNLHVRDRIGICALVVIVKGVEGSAADHARFARTNAARCVRIFAAVVWIILTSPWVHLTVREIAGNRKQERGIDQPGWSLLAPSSAEKDTLHRTHVVGESIRYDLWHHLKLRKAVAF
mmetsp:Transcript_19233/g.63550  ORF Transcript_19233/g.63550 Transcript_19233/m.63550 type:complete len:327 (-) Transcript_19233:2506-3486(-)